MKQRILQNYILRAAMLLASAAFLTLAGLWVITRYDNKYIAKAPLTQESFAQTPEKGCCCLVDGWELYPDALLSPADFAACSEPAYHTWAGEYPNLSPFHADKNPYGTATYRLRLRGDGIATLYLPELPCASRVYAGGRYLGWTGDVSPESYTPLIHDSFYSFPLGEDTELIIQTANYSHYYGGVWFVPVIGNPDAVNRLASFRMMCLLFALRICYPFFRLLGLPSVRVLYALEDAAALFCLYFSLRIVLLLFSPNGFGRVGRLLAVLSLIVCTAGVVIPLFVIPALPGLVTVYDPALSWYKVLLSCLFISLNVYGSLSGISYTGVILAASTAKGTSLPDPALSWQRRYPPLPDRRSQPCLHYGFRYEMRHCKRRPAPHFPPLLHYQRRQGRTGARTCHHPRDHLGARGNHRSLLEKGKGNHLHDQPAFADLRGFPVWQFLYSNLFTPLSFHAAERHARDDILGQKQIHKDDRHDCQQNHHVYFSHITVHIIGATKERDQNRHGHLLL